MCEHQVGSVSEVHRAFTLQVRPPCGFFFYVQVWSRDNSIVSTEVTLGPQRGGAATAPPGGRGAQLRAVVRSGTPAHVSRLVSTDDAKHHVEGMLGLKRKTKKKEGKTRFGDLHG